jgi:hypothetical protein
MVARPIHHTFMLNPASDLDVALEALLADGWHLEGGRGVGCRINGIDFHLVRMTRYGTVTPIEKDGPYELPPAADPGASSAS